MELSHGQRKTYLIGLLPAKDMHVKTGALNTTTDALAWKKGQEWERDMAQGYLICSSVIFLGFC
jgi:hypothetical protein